MDDIEEYQKIVLLVSNFVGADIPQPFHPIAYSRVKLPDRWRDLLFDKLDDDKLSLRTVSSKVGTGVKSISEEDEPLVVVI